MFHFSEIKKTGAAIISVISGNVDLEYKLKQSLIDKKTY